jgi:hypothetical protein
VASDFSGEPLPLDFAGSGKGRSSPVSIFANLPGLVAVEVVDQCPSAAFTSVIARLLQRQAQRLAGELLGLQRDEDVADRDAVVGRLAQGFSKRSLPATSPRSATRGRWRTSSP